MMDRAKDGQRGALRINVIDAQQARHSTEPVGMAHALIAALSLEPETLAEWELALGRYVEPPPHDLFADWKPGLCEEPWDRGLLIVDLRARLLVHRTLREKWLREGSYPYHLHGEETDCWFNFEVPADWRFLAYKESWSAVSERRRQQRQAASPLDARQVLFGRALCEFVADGCLTAEDPSPATIRSLHERWLLTPRLDLHGRSPREVLLERRERIDEDVQAMAHAWSRLGHAPRGLARSTAAYRFGGFGTHENILYYELVRHLLHAGMEQVREGLAGRKHGSGDGHAARRGEDCPAMSDAVTLAEHLEQRMRRWLTTPQLELSRHSPAQVIDRERRRLPMCESASMADSVLDEDCPLCQMLADHPAPTFWFLDGCNMDRDYAFSLHLSREDWELERAMYGDEDCTDALDRRDHAPAEIAERPTQAADDDDVLTVKLCPREEPPAGSSAIREDSPWRTCFFNPSFLDEASPAIAVQVLLFDVAAKLGELQQDLRGSQRERRFAKSLLAEFTKLRVAIGDRSNWQAEAVRQELSRGLEHVVAERRDLTAKRNDLECQLDRLLTSVSQVLAGS